MKRHQSCFGFTQDEVNDLLSVYQLSDYSDQIKSWYNGYLFENTEIYNPWSVLKYVNKLLTSEDKSPSTFWGNTSSNDIVYQYIQQADQQMKSEFEELIKDKSIVKHIKQDLTYRDMDDIQNIYSFMLMTGYLRQLGKKEQIITFACQTLRFTKSLKILLLVISKTSHQFAAMILFIV